jgi:hypothetical protein
LAHLLRRYCQACVSPEFAGKFIFISLSFIAASCLLFMSGGFGTCGDAQDRTMNRFDASELPTADDCELLLRGVQDELGNRIRLLQIVVLADGFILRGQANTYFAKQLAQHVVMRLSARPVLANEIEVI